MQLEIFEVNRKANKSKRFLSRLLAYRRLNIHQRINLKYQYRFYLAPGVSNTPGYAKFINGATVLDKLNDYQSFYDNYTRGRRGFM
jgi:hypothetical protein